MTPIYRRRLKLPSGLQLNALVCSTTASFPRKSLSFLYLEYLLTCNQQEIRSLLAVDGHLFGFPSMRISHLLLDAWPHISSHPELTSRLRAHSLNSHSSLDRTSSHLIAERLENRRQARAAASVDGTPASEAFRSVPYPYLPPEDIMKTRLQKYIEATGNLALSKQACASCGGMMFRKFMHRGSVSVNSIPNAHHLQPAAPHPSHLLTRELLLCPEAVCSIDNEIACTFCTKCWDSLVRDRQPTFALARGFWVGAVPLEISCLNMAERLLIQLEFPRIYLVKLMPKKKNRGGKWGSLPLDQLMDGMKGSVCSVHMPTTDVVKMLEGKLAQRPMLPNPTWVLSHTLSLAFLGFGRSVPYHLRGLFTINRRRVMSAIQILKRINPLYENVEWNEDVLDNLPPEAIPSSITARSKVDRHLKKLAESEGVGYVRIDEDEDDDGMGDDDYDDDDDDDDDDGNDDETEQGATSDSMKGDGEASTKDSNGDVCMEEGEDTETMHGSFKPALSTCTFGTPH